VADQDYTFGPTFSRCLRPSASWYSIHHARARRPLEQTPILSAIVDSAAPLSRWLPMMTFET
jgi:hypothetical protein